MSYPLDDDPICPKCRNSDMEWEPCWQCHGEGCFDLHDDDPVNYAEGEEFEKCDECHGKGGYLVCHSCIAKAQEAR